MKAKDIDRIVDAVTAKFRVFGGSMISAYNPLGHALKEKAPMFALGVDVRSVVRFVLNEARKQERAE